MSLKLNILGHEVANPLMSAAGGLCRTLDELQRMTASISGSLVSKSCTTAPRDGNPEPRYCGLPLGSINSMGPPNLEFDFYLNYSSEQHDCKRRSFFFSMSALSTGENAAVSRGHAPVAQE